jgi:hypothetical protein
MSLEMQIFGFTADEICELLLQDDSEITDIIAHALKQSIHEMAGLDTKPSAADVLSQLKRAA